MRRKQIAGSKMQPLVGRRNEDGTTTRQHETPETGLGGVTYEGSPHPAPFRLRVRPEIALREAAPEMLELLERIVLLNLIPECRTMVDIRAVVKAAKGEP